MEKQPYTAYTRWLLKKVSEELCGKIDQPTVDLKLVYVPLWQYIHHSLPLQMCSSTNSTGKKHIAMPGIEPGPPA